MATSRTTLARSTWRCARTPTIARARSSIRCGRRALTRYQVLERLGTGTDATTRVALKPVTGRAHQLRVHLLALGHPIVGDPLYTPPELAATATLARMHLHATRIAFIHPRTRVALQFDSPVPF